MYPRYEPLKLASRRSGRGRGSIPARSCYDGSSFSGVYMRSRSDLWRGIKSQPGKFGKHVFTSFSVVFTIVKGLTYFFPKVEFDGWVRLSIILVGCLIYAGNEVWKPSRIEFKVPTCDTCIEILFGDIFAQDGIRAIAVNEFFDSELGKPV